MRIADVQFPSLVGAHAGVFKLQGRSIGQIGSIVVLCRRFWFLQLKNPRADVMKDDWRSLSNAVCMVGEKFIPVHAGGACGFPARPVKIVLDLMGMKRSRCKRFRWTIQPFGRVANWCLGTYGV